MKEVILLLHPVFGVLAILAAVWVFVEALNVSESGSSASRLRIASVLCAVCVWLTYIIGGYWYVRYYGTDKAIIKAGPWAFGHNFFMEVKEHVFLTLVLLSTYLPIVAFGKITSNKAARKVVLWVAGLVVAIGLSMEGAGSIISTSVRIGLLFKGQGG
ncbi:MAG: hypothetical protein GXP31_17285 [Kiritimatiellaeota bacterium]|nr:hypothetical protein [Kiritimatiellota bacterium]